VVAGAETVLISPFSGTALVADGEAGASVGDIAAIDADGTGDDGAAAEGAPATGATGAAGGADASGAAGTEGGTAAEIATAEVGSAAADGAAGDVVASAQAGGGASAEGAGTGTDTDVAVTGTGTGVAAAGTGADVAASGTGTEGAATSTGTEAAATMAGEGASADGAPLVVASAPSAPDTPPAPGQPGTDVSAPSQPATAGSPTRSEAPAVVIAGPGGVRIAQGPGAMPEAQTEVRLDAISYDAEGAVILAGRGPAETDIRVLINNQPIQLGEIGPGGAWSLQLPDVDPGTYTLSVAGLAPDGTVASQVDTPFLREDPDRIAGSPATASGGTEVITVQPGFTLWGMAHDRFGEGILYVQIFEENRDQIEDPDWIFPGQIFRMPDLPRVPDSD
jgi:nucleoid-associated protein YgaU